MPAPTVTQAAAVAITTYAGATFSGVVATFSRPDAAGLASTIDWGDGQGSGGAITPLPNHSFQVAGTHVFGQPGTYTLVVTIDEGAAASTQVQATATVFPAYLRLDVAFNSAVLGGASQLPTQGTVTVVVVPPAAPPAANPSAVPAVVVQFQVQVTIPPRVPATDQISWASTVEHGLGEVMAVMPPPVSPPSNRAGTSGTASPALGVEFGPSVPQTSAWISSVTLALLGTPRMATGSSATITIELAQLGSGLEPFVARTEEEPYHLPLHRVADRSELIGCPGAQSSFGVSAERQTGSSPGSDSGRRRVGTEAVSKSQTAWSSLTIHSVLQGATLWVAFHTLYSSIFQHVPSTQPVLPRAKRRVGL